MRDSSLPVYHGMVSIKQMVEGFQPPTKREVSE